MNSQRRAPRPTRRDKAGGPEHGQGVAAVMQFGEIGQQLRAYRLESGLRAEEIAAKLGVSRAALYRYEKGEVIKLDTINRLAELLKISPLSLLGIGMEYYNRPIGYFERIRQLEEQAEQILQVNDQLCYLTTGQSYDAGLHDVLDAATTLPGLDEATARDRFEQVLGILAERKRMYAQRRPNIIAMLSVARLRNFLAGGVAGGIPMEAPLRQRLRRRAADEVASIADQMEAEPMGVQYGLLAHAEPTGAFKIVRTRDRGWLAINPFRPDATPALSTGVAMITSAEEAIVAHQRVAEGLWRDALKGAAAAAHLRELLAESGSV
jgi:transcriptional regulator with XRE-family HTH domain